MKSMWKFIRIFIVAAFAITIIAAMSPLITIAGAIGFWYFSKKNPNPRFKNIALVALIVGILGTIFITPNLSNTKNTSTQSTISSTTDESTAFSTNSSSSTTEESKTSSTSSSSSTTEVNTETSSSTEQQTEASTQSQTQTQEQEQQTTSQGAEVVYVARYGEADVYWYDQSNMPKNTNFNNVVRMSEAEAIARGKRHTTKE